MKTHFQWLFFRAIRWVLAASVPALADGAEGQRVADDDDEAARAGDGRVEQPRRRQEAELRLLVLGRFVGVLARRKRQSVTTQYPKERTLLAST